MKYRPSPTFAIAMAVLLGLGAAGGWIWHKMSLVPPELRAKLGLTGCLGYKPEAFRPPPTPEQFAALQRKSLVLKAQLVAEFPALKVTARPVPADKNGFLLLFKLSGGPGVDSPPLSEEFRQTLNADEPLDAAVAQRCLDGHAELVGQIERIAALTSRSSCDMPAGYSGFIGARTGKTCCDILLLKARLAAANHDEVETLRLVTAAGNLGDHYREVESPTLLCETVAILIDMEIARRSVNSLLPAIGRNADLKRWQNTLGRRRYDTAELARVMRGEWDTSSEYLAFPALLDAAEHHELPDAEAVERAYCSWFSTCVTRLPACPLADAFTVLKPPGDVPHLSKEGQNIMADLTIGTQAWSKGYVHMASQHAQYQAALELLMLEQAGAKLAAGDAARVALDPVSGKAFGFNPDQRELTGPGGSADMDLKPLKLPW